MGPVDIIQENQNFLVRQPDSEQEMNIHIDPENHTLTMEGMWWYQGVYRLKEMEDNTQILLEVNNVASGLSRWIVPFISRRKKKDFQKNFNALVHKLRKEME